MRAHMTHYLATSTPFSASPPVSARSENFADDECSSSSSLDFIMAGLNDEDAGDPRFADEDTRPTSTKELVGFYAYSFAAEVFIVCGIGRSASSSPRPCLSCSYIIKRLLHTYNA